MMLANGSHFWSSICCSRIIDSTTNLMFMYNYGEYEAAISIDGELLAGSLPQKQFKMITGWLAFHEEEAYKALNQAVKGEHFDKIKPM